MRTFVILVSVVVLAVGCGSDANEETRTATIPNQPGGEEGKAFCEQLPEDLIVATIGEPFRTFDAVPLNDFPAPGVRGWECQWEWINPAGDQRSLKVDWLDFSGALDGSLDASWKGTRDITEAFAEPLENLGDEALTTKQQGLVGIAARGGQIQVTTQGGAKGSSSPPDTDVLSLVTSTMLAAEL